jgi:hypothetical protein
VPLDGKNRDYQKYVRPEFSYTRSDDPLFVIPDAVSENTPKFNQQVLHLAVEFVFATTLGCRQGSSPLIRNVIGQLIQLGASRRQNQLQNVVDMNSLLGKFSVTGLRTELRVIAEDGF